MCSFLFLKTSAPVDQAAIERSNVFARDRGPDHTGMVRLTSRSGSHLLLLHNLLDMSGHAVHQPVCWGEPLSAALLFNGEIYNFRNLAEVVADTHALLPAYQRLGADLPDVIDGEYALVVLDLSADKALIAVDPFLTKPLFLGYGVNGTDFGVATCASALHASGLIRVQMMPPNSRVVVDLQDPQRAVISTPVVQFSLLQPVASYDEWIEAFIEAVRKRATHGAQENAVFLSSGYDSGAICLALNLLGIRYRTLTIRSGESASVLDARLQLNATAGNRSPLVYDGLTQEQIETISSDIARFVEPFEYQHFDCPGIVSAPARDGGAIGAYFLAREARQHNLLVNLSGSGADEIISDYGHAGTRFYYHSEFGGLFPQELEGFFPWKKFYGDTQRSYLFKDEYVLGRFGLEGRYPFLDRHLVQAFLALTPELKNCEYKAPVAEFLRRYSYPFEPGKKCGFAPAEVPALQRGAFVRLMEWFRPIRSLRFRKS